jgi:hypothetical protein
MRTFEHVLGRPAEVCHVVIEHVDLLNLSGWEGQKAQKNQVCGFRKSL